MKRHGATVDRVALLIAILAVFSAVFSGCRAEPRTVSHAIALARGAGVKFFAPAGHVRIIGWDRDTLRVEGRLGAGEKFFFQGDSRGAKFGVDWRAQPEKSQLSEFTIYVPRTSTIAIKGATTDIEATDVSGFYYTVSGRLRLVGTVREAQLESVSGPIEVNGTSPWIRLRSAGGAVSLRGAVEDVAVATVTGNITLFPGSPTRVRVETMDGRVQYAGGLARRGMLDVDTHAGSVDLRLLRAVSAKLDVETISGTWADSTANFARVVASRGGQVHSGTLGTRDSSEARVRVVTFSGGVRLLFPDTVTR
jgi:hypothetical protein